MTNSSKNGTTTRRPTLGVVVVVEAEVVVEVLAVVVAEEAVVAEILGEVVAVDVPSVEISLSTGMIRERRNGLEEIVPMVQRKTENVVRFTVEINRSTEIRGKRNGVVDIRAREIGSAEDPRISGHHMVVREARGASTESRKEATGGHLTKIKMMAEALSGATNHVARTNITTKKRRSKIWTTCSPRSRKS
uniref:(northern house mosquito) hypothetical protein n=1 Tax=Culex pipiens TaxID=7175 RepID=A0A8D8C2Z9_CULPI